MAGIDKSDFQPLGRPQLSSTVGPHVGGEASLTRVEYRDVGTKTDASSLVRLCSVLRNVVMRLHERCFSLMMSFEAVSLLEHLEVQDVAQRINCLSFIFDLLLFYTYTNN